MRFLIRFHFPTEHGNDLLRDAKFGEKMGRMLADLKAEAAYFTTVDRHRGGYIVVNLEDASKIPAMVEPLFFWLKAEVEFIPVMLPQDLAKAGDDIAAAMKKWG